MVVVWFSLLAIAALIILFQCSVSLDSSTKSAKEHLKGIGNTLNELLRISGKSVLELEEENAELKNRLKTERDEEKMAQVQYFMDCHRILDEMNVPRNSESDENFDGFHGHYLRERLQHVKTRFRESTK